MIRGVLKRDISKQAFRFAIVGIESTILNYLVFLIFFSFFNINYLVSAATGFIAGVFFGFFFNKTYTFESEKTTKFSLPRYFLVYLVSLAINLVLLKLIVENTNLGAIAGNIILAPFIIIINFLGSKLIAFENRKW